MPTYTLKDLKTQETWDVICSWNDLQTMLNEMPNIKQMLSTPKLVSDTGSLLGKTDDGWKDVLDKVKSGSGRANTIKT